LPSRLLVFLLKRNLRRGPIITYLKVGGLEVELIFNKNIIKPEDNIEYIKEAIDTTPVLYIK